EELVLFDGTANYSAELILIEKSLGGTRLVVEPTGGRELAVAVLNEGAAMELVAARRGHEADLRRAVARGGIGIRGRERHLRHLVQKQQVRREIAGIGANKIVLNIDAVQGDVGERGALSVDDGDAAAGHLGAHLSGDE